MANKVLTIGQILLIEQITALLGLVSRVGEAQIDAPKMNMMIELLETVKADDLKVTVASVMLMLKVRHAEAERNDCPVYANAIGGIIVLLIVLRRECKG